MIRILRRLDRDRRGIAATEFALVAPVLVLFIVGIAQLGVLFMANAGLRNAVAEGARLATIWPRPSDTAIRDQILSHDFGLEPTRMSTPTITHGTDANVNYVDIRASYLVRLDFVFFEMPPFELTATRRAFVAPATAS